MANISRYFWIDIAITFHLTAHDAYKISHLQPAMTRISFQGGNLPNGKPVEEADVLKVKSVSSTHSGTYQCTAMDSSGRSAQKTVEVVVNYPPQVSVSEVVIHALSGDVAELVCTVVGHPTPQVVWSKGGQVVKMDKRRSIHQENTRHSLTILQLGEEDWGMYACSARNSQGMSHKDIKLTASSSEELSSGTSRLGTYFETGYLIIMVLISLRFQKRINNWHAWIIDSVTWFIKVQRTRQFKLYQSVWTSYAKLIANSSLAQCWPLFMLTAQYFM